MSIYWDDARDRWRWQFKATVDGERHRFSKLLPRGWSEAQAARYDEQETARTYARIATGRRVSTVPLIALAVKLYLDERVPDLSDGKNSAANLLHLLPHYDGKGLDQLGAVARDYMKKQRATLAPATIKQRLATLRAASTYALKYHSVGSMEWIEQIPMPSVDNDRKVYLRRVEVLRLARAIKDRPTRAWVLLTFATGSRPGELFRSEPVAGTHFAKKLKNGEFALKPVVPKFRRYMRHWPMPHDYTWHSKLFRAARKSLGLDHVHAHDLRHSTASALVAGGATLAQVGKVLNHKTAQASNRYAHLYNEEQERLLAGVVGQKRPHKLADRPETRMDARGRKRSNGL
jgi:integrase